MLAVEIKNLNFGYDELLFDNFNFSIEKGSFMTVVGDSCSGKSSLFKILSNKYDFEGSITYFNKRYEYAFEKGYIGFVSLSEDFLNGNVGDLFIDLLINKGRSLDKINSEINRVCRKFGIEDLVFSDYRDLSDENKILVMFAYNLLLKPKVLIIDNALGVLGNCKKNVIIELKRMNKRCSILNITNDTEEAIIGSDVYIINDGHYKVDDLNANVFVSNNLIVPFMVDLSDKLMVYGLISKYYFDMKELVDVLWD